MTDRQVLGVYSIWQSNPALCRVLPQALQSRRELSRPSLTAMKPMKCPCQSPGTAASTPSRSWLYCAASALIRYLKVLILHSGSNQRTWMHCAVLHVLLVTLREISILTWTVLYRTSYVIWCSCFLFYRRWIDCLESDLFCI